MKPTPDMTLEELQEAMAHGTVTLDEAEAWLVSRLSGWGELEKAQRTQLRGALNEAAP